MISTKILGFFQPEIHNFCYAFLTVYCSNLGHSVSFINENIAVSKFMVRLSFSARPEFFELLPLAAVLQNYETDEEIATLATNLLVVLGNTMTLEKHIPNAIEAIREVVKCPLWSARLVIAEFFPIFVFYNMPTIHSNGEWVLQVRLR